MKFLKYISYNYQILCPLPILVIVLNKLFPVYQLNYIFPWQFLERNYFAVIDSLSRSFMTQLDLTVNSSRIV